MATEIKYSNLPVVEREEHLRANADTTENTNIKRHYSASEKDEFREYHMNFFLDIDKLEEELSEMSQPLKDRIKALKGSASEVFTKVKKGYEVQEVELFGFKNYDNNLMEYFNAEGVFMSSRRLAPNEMQTTIFRNLSEGTNG